MSTVAPPAHVAAPHIPALTREHGLDALRVIAFVILILYHSGMGYVTWGWHVKNPEQSTALEHVMIFFNRWRLPLLFFISGAGVAFALRRRTLLQFAGERLRRLLLPLVVGMFVIVPPQIYLEHLFRGRQYSSYADFYRSVFEFVSYPQGSFSWHHLWFVAYVLVFALVGIPLFAVLRSAKGRRGIDAFAASLERHALAIYLVNVPNLLVGILLGPHWPVRHNLTSDWANLTGTFLTFFWGYVFASSPRLLDIVTRRRREFLILGIAVTAIFYGLRLTGTAAWPAPAALVTWNLVSGYMGMAWIFTLIGYARTLVTRSSTFLRWATEAVYPFYIIHQTITVALVYWMVAWPASLWLKLALAVAGTFLGSFAFVEIVRRIKPLRPLFGFKYDRA